MPLSLLAREAATRAETREAVAWRADMSRTAQSFEVARNTEFAHLPGIKQSAIITVLGGGFTALLNPRLRDPMVKRRVAFWLGHSLPVMRAAIQSTPASTFTLTSSGPSGTKPELALRLALAGQPETVPDTSVKTRPEKRHEAPTGCAADAAAQKRGRPGGYRHPEGEVGFADALPAGMRAAAPPAARDLTVPTSTALVGRSILYRWGDGVGWCVGKITERNTNTRLRMPSKDMVNFLVYYEVDGDTAQHNLELAHCRGDNEAKHPYGSWVLLEPEAEAVAAAGDETG